MSDKPKQASVIVGAQWGDEGKGKVVDLCAEYADVVARYAGGANAGHTLVIGGEKLIFHLIPSGILRERTVCMLGQGTVIDPIVLNAEIEALQKRGIPTENRIFVSDRAHIVLPHHQTVDAIKDARTGIGTTKRGIGPAYQDKVSRVGLRAIDLVDSSTLTDKLEANREGWSSFLKGHPIDEDAENAFMRAAENIAPRVADVGRLVAAALYDQKSVLAEGAQGTLLDIDAGTYPFVTSSTATSGGACAGLGIGPTAIGSVLGITKAYTTRVGSGPFPTELGGTAGDALREAGAEYGATTGRPRRCGWLDIPALRYAVQVNGLTSLAITKLDVLSTLDEVPICTHYMLGNERLDRLPSTDLEQVVPGYEHLPGWLEDIQDCRSRAELPSAARSYIERVEELVGCPIEIVSLGADRAQSFGKTNLF